MALEKIDGFPFGYRKRVVHQKSAVCRSSEAPLGERRTDRREDRGHGMVRLDNGTNEDWMAGYMKERKRSRMRLKDNPGRMDRKIQEHEEW
ncbi:hypothetical protein J6590_052124 [Homalodisca vitripennis]|nr:hypothetical protein J6590_052124 [Homalodisca vitripennis]